MSLFNSNNPKEQPHSGILGAFSVDTIKWEPENDAEASIIVHKHIYEDFPNGSYLIVGPSQMAVFINNMTSGNSLDGGVGGDTQVSVFNGPCKIKLDTGDSRFAPFRNISHALTGGESAFHSTVYFINTTYMNELSWGTQAPIVVEDPEEEINVHVRAFGLFGVHINQTDSASSIIDARKFLQKVVGTRADFTRNELISFMRAKILEYVPDLLAKNMVEQKIGILKISTKLSEFSQNIQEKLVEHFSEFGLTLDNFSFTNINAPDEDLRAINDMKIQRKRDRLEAEGTAAKMDIESEARARMRAREGYTYQQEQSYGVLNSAAQNEGVASTFIGTGLGLGVGAGIGGAVGAGIGNLTQNAFGVMPNMTTTPNNQVPNSDTISCPNCNTPNATNAKFCMSCGQQLVQEEHCPDCGSIITKGARFCSSCGKKLGNTCPNCKKELSPDARFCPDCGTKV